MELQRLLPRLGHRNWIAVVDSAFPELVAPGVTTFVGGDLEGTLRALEACSHVRYDAFLDSELDYLDERESVGIQAYRDRLDRFLEGVPTTRLPHERIIHMLDEAARTYRVVVIKTDARLPYTSLFLRLECGYWDERAESRLRERIPESGGALPSAAALTDESPV